MLLYIFDAKKGCKKKSLNKLSLAADLLKAGFSDYSSVFDKNILDAMTSYYNEKIHK